MRIKTFTIIGLLLYCLIIFLPPLMYGYVYPNLGDDSAGHLGTFDQLKESITGVRYGAYILVGYPLIFLSELLNTNIDTIYLWFAYIALAVAGVVVYKVMADLAGRLAGWIALVLVVWCAQGLLFLFYYGQIFNLISMGILLPLILWLSIKYFMVKRILHGFLLFSCVIVFSIFHMNGIYLSIMAGFIVVVYIIYCRVRKTPIDRKKVLLGSEIAIVSVLALVTFMLHPATSYFGTMTLTGFIANIGVKLSVPLEPYIMDIISPTLLVLMTLSVVYWRDILNNASKQLKTVIVILLNAIMVLVVAILVSVDPWRQALDLAIVLPLLIAGFIGLIVRMKNKIITLIVILVIVFGLSHNLTTWFGYNSAMRPVDLAAMLYADKYQTFSCSDTVAYWIYGRYTSAQWQKNNGDIVFVRNQPMTPRSTPDNIWFQGHGWEPDVNYKLLRVFSDEVVTIEVYGVKSYEDSGSHSLLQ